jgi:hypothetical protein
MNKNRIASLAAAGALVVVACIIPPRVEAQAIARRVSSVRDGKVRMSFAARPDICGFDNGISTNFRETGNDRSNWSKEKSEVGAAKDPFASSRPFRTGLSRDFARTWEEGGALNPA